MGTDHCIAAFRTALSVQARTPRSVLIDVGAGTVARDYHNGITCAIQVGCAGGLDFLTGRNHRVFLHRFRLFGFGGEGEKRGEQQEQGQEQGQVLFHE